MRRDQLEHLIRAAGGLLGEDTVIVIGSQAILATAPSPAEEVLVRSMEADLLPLDDPTEEKADLIDGVLGSGSMFDDTHGIHADGVSMATPVLPEGWRDRLVEISNANTNGIKGLCLESHDLIVSKLAAGRSKDSSSVKPPSEPGSLNRRSWSSGSAAPSCRVQHVPKSWPGSAGWPPELAWKRPNDVTVAANANHRLRAWTEAGSATSDPLL